MPKPRSSDGQKNLIGKRLLEARLKCDMSQRDLAVALQCHGLDVDRNVITRIETGKRYVTDIELQALAEVLGVTYSYLIDGKKTK